jgi:hypothetical protein
MKNFNGRPFFSLFFVARANQKIRILALGSESTYPWRKGGVMETFMSCFIVVSILYSRRRCGVFEHSVNVCRIKTTIKHDINVSITPPFLQG